uniref:Uncharacterized protein n=1 Tax=Rhizophora mucronata TaxID=61149 RepID=A0A2P2PKM1_RHIMU
MVKKGCEARENLFCLPSTVQPASSDEHINSSFYKLYNLGSLEIVLT